jgi:hypothetical protein
MRWVRLEVWAPDVLFTAMISPVHAALAKRGAHQLFRRAAPKQAGDASGHMVDVANKRLALAVPTYAAVCESHGPPMPGVRGTAVALHDLIRHCDRASLAILVTNVACLVSRPC